MADQEVCFTYRGTFPGFPLTALTDSQQDSSFCCKKFLWSILGDLDRMIERETSRAIFDVGYTDALPRHVDEIRCKVERLVAHDLFESPEVRDDFLCRVGIKLQELFDAFNKWNSWQVSVEDYERKHGDTVPDPPASMSERSKLLPWVRFCANRATLPNADSLKQAQAQGSIAETAIRLQYLPFGGRTILEHWRKDVNDMVDSLLQVQRTYTTTLTKVIVWFVANESISSIPAKQFERRA